MSRATLRSPVLCGDSCLFDGHDEPPDQPRDLVQLSGIVHLDGARQPRQAFVVAQCGDIAGNNRGHRPDEFGLRGVLHRIASVKTRHHRIFVANKSIWRPRCAQAGDRVVAQLLRRNRRFGVNKQRQTAAVYRVSAACRRPPARAELVLCKREGLCYTLLACEHPFRLFLGSSAVEHSTVNRMVAGSNPARGARYLLRRYSPEAADSRQGFEKPPKIVTACSTGHRRRAQLSASSRCSLLVRGAGNFAGYRHNDDQLPARRITSTGTLLWGN